MARWDGIVALWDCAGVQNLSTWAHELIHAADDRLGKLGKCKVNNEVVAELGGAVLLQCLGKPVEADLGGAWNISSHGVGILNYIRYQLAKNC